MRFGHRVFAHSFFRPALFRCALLACAITALAGCGDDAGGGDAASDAALGCDACATSELCLAYFSDGGDDHEECAPAPAECSDGTCSDACRGAAYALCGEGYLGVSCSETIQLIISCN